MLSSLFHSTTIPVLEEVVEFAQARHTVLAGNIANLDTPGYEVRDLSPGDFQQRLRQAIEERHQPAVIRSPGEPQETQPTPLAEVAEASQAILRHDGVNVGMEYQVSEMVKNQMQHNVALAIMNSQFRLLQTAIGLRV